MSLIVHEGKVGAVGTTNEAAAGYYLVKWLSEPHTLHADTEGMSEIISAGKMVVDALYFNPVHCAQNWYTPSAIATVMEVNISCGLACECSQSVRPMRYHVHA